MGLPPQLFLDPKNDPTGGYPDSPDMNPQTASGASFQGGQKNQPKPPGTLKRMLMGFFEGMAQPFNETQSEINQRNAMSQASLQNAATNEGYRQFQQKMGEFSMDQVPFFNPLTGDSMMVPRKDYGKLMQEVLKAQGGIEQKKIQFGPGLPLDDDIAQMAGYPELAGKPLAPNQFNQVIKSVNAKGYQIKDFGNEGQWLVDRAGNKIKRMGNSASIDRMNILGPRVSVAMVNGVPTFVPNAMAAGLPAANMDPGAAARKAGAIAFSTGTEGDQIQSFRAFAGHANDLDQFSQQFAQSTPKLASKPLLWLRQNASDDPRVAAYIAKIDPVKKEFETFLLNNRALYESDRKTADMILSENMPASQMHSAISSFMHTAAIRMGSLNAKFRDLYGQDSPTMLDPETKRILQRFGQLGAYNAYDQGSAAPKTSTGETKVWQGHTYQRSGPGQPWKLVTK